MDLRIGTYALWFPPEATVKAKVSIPPIDNFGEAGTVWEISVGSFSYFIHLDTNREPAYLAEFILASTKKRVDLRPITINGIDGATYGGYDPKRSWIDWCFRKGELMIWINLQSYGLPSESDKALHSKIIESLRYVPERTTYRMGAT